MLRLTLSSDHRAIDGVMAARFLQRLREILENPGLLS
jgi:pyruvate dehydrogenase E2 component (dihydrolipoamide acetyltransferase)